ncbi:glycoside hydrolase family 76 protein [Microbacterium sp. P04]|uniref:glycoside hydrolase family 76 protein n=1 Tax=Microbacterium sp. P04 TaxID=3366947 RepID=UPI0037460E47
MDRAIAPAMMSGMAISADLPDDVPDDDVSQAEWNDRARAAEEAVLACFGGGIPGLTWARAVWPRLPLVGGGASGPRWHYWWSAQLVDAAIDAARHRPSAVARRRARSLARGVWLRNGASWSRPFYDDIAWLALAFQRGADVVGQRRAARQLEARLAGAIDPAVGALPWRVDSRLFNAPANGPAAILFARTGRLGAAHALADWIDDTLRDPASGLVIDGIEVEDGAVRRVTELYTYCQGVALGAEIALARAEPGTRPLHRAIALIDAIATWTAPSGVLPGSGGGDGGLFAAITCRYLADAAHYLDGADAAAQPDGSTDAPGDTAGDLPPRLRAAASARRLVLANAAAVWSGRAQVDGRPLFAADWGRDADTAAASPEHGLSVQLGGWLALEAAVDATSRRVDTSPPRRHQSDAAGMSSRRDDVDSAAAPRS